MKLVSLVSLGAAIGAVVGAFPTVAQPGSFTVFPNEPRMAGVSFKLRF